MPARLPTIANALLPELSPLMPVEIRFSDRLMNLRHSSTSTVMGGVVDAPVSPITSKAFSSFITLMRAASRLWSGDTRTGGALDTCDTPLFFCGDEEERVCAESQPTMKAELPSRETRESLLRPHALQGDHRPPQHLPKSPPKTQPELEPQYMTIWTTNASAMPVLLSCARVVALTWRGIGSVRARNPGFPTTTVRQFQWPGPPDDTGGGALTTRGWSVACEGGLVRATPSQTAAPVRGKPSAQDSPWLRPQPIEHLRRSPIRQR